MSQQTPLLNHPLALPSVFRPEDLMQAVRSSRRLESAPAPPVCVLDFDGDLSDGLACDASVSVVSTWACFHTQMLALTVDGIRCGVVPRTIGGPYAVLIAEQLHATGVEVIVGLTSAGRVSADVPLPCVVIADEAVRDEGTSLHYVPPSETLPTPTPALAAHLVRALEPLGHVRQGLVWTTDAPYRETQAQLDSWAKRGVLAVEMQAAALFAFAQARGAAVGVVALVSNAVDHAGDQFDTGEHDYRTRVLAGIARAAGAFLADRAPARDRR